MNARDSPGGPSAGDAVDGLDVYWRPGCPYCRGLLRRLGRAGVVVRRHNIWQDEQARLFVVAHNAGAETVPTVALGGQVWSNPDPGRVIELLRARHPELVAAPSRPSHRGRLWRRHRSL